MVEETHLIVLVDVLSPRVLLVERFLNGFTDTLVVSFRTSLSGKKFEGKTIILSYQKDVAKHCKLFLIPEGLLFEENLRLKLPIFFDIKDVWYFFPTDSSLSTIPFDLFSFIFYYLSRYEEYQNAARDPFGRWNYKFSLEAKNNVPIIPIVDYWTTVFIKTICPNARFKKGEIQATFDIDQVWAFRNNGIFNNTLRGFKNLISLNGALLKSQFRFMLTGNDPFDLSQYLDVDTLPKNTRFFFLLADARSLYDKNHSPQNPFFQLFISNIANKFRTGIHPSFQSTIEQGLLERELSRYEQITDRVATDSRQHYLKFELPSSYKLLIKQGIQSDYSMGFPDKNAFRGGTSHAFYFFDLESNELTDLQLFPFCAMDVTFRLYEGMSIEEAILEGKRLQELCINYGGTFRFIWHNSSFAKATGWQGWHRVFNTLLKGA